jgi:hypothetical protein
MSLCLPAKILTQHLVVLGKTGAGKSSALRHIAEHLLTGQKRFCCVDPKGDWWGLKCSADGKSAGFPVIAFGDFKDPKATDVPINQHSGKQVAELIVSGNRPAIIGLRGWMPSAQARFWIDFASVVFNSNECGGLNLFIDEIQNFAPKERAGFGDENLALHWTKRLLSEGRGLGLTIFCGSQRPQSVHNGVLSQCETLVAMRLTHDRDCSAVEDWLRRCRDKSKRQEVLSSIPEMVRGQGWVWSPEIGFGPEVISFPLFTTFDSFAPPQLQKRVASSGWAAVNLEAVKEKMAALIEDAKANDPRELKARIAELQAENRKLANSRNSVPAPKPPKAPRLKIVKVPVIDEHYLDVIDQELQGIPDIVDTLGRMLKEARQIGADAKAALAATGCSGGLRPPVVPPQRRNVPPPLKSPISNVKSPLPLNGDYHPGKCERELMRVLSQFSAGITFAKLSLCSGYSQTSSSFEKALGLLRTNGILVGGNTELMRPTDRLEQFGPFEPLPSGRELAEFWFNFPHFGACERAVLKAVCQSPDGLDYQTLGETSKKPDGSSYSATSSSFEKAVGKLRTAGLIVGRNTELIRPSDDLLEALNS